MRRSTEHGRGERGEHDFATKPRTERGECRADCRAGGSKCNGEWSGHEAKAALHEVAVAAGVKPGQLMFPLRAALSGRAHGPDLGAILGLLGRARSIARLREFARVLAHG